MKISKNKTLKEVKELFNFIFPELTIEFYKNSFDPFDLAPSKLECDGNTKLLEINPDINGSEIHFDYSSTVHYFVDQFERKFGLFIQVFRSRNIIRFHPTLKNNLTLESFNNLN